MPDPSWPHIGSACGWPAAETWQLLFGRLACHRIAWLGRSASSPLFSLETCGSRAKLGRGEAKLLNQAPHSNSASQISAVSPPTPVKNPYRDNLPKLNWSDPLSFHPWPIPRHVVLNSLIPAGRSGVGTGWAVIAEGSTELADGSAVGEFVSTDSGGGSSGGGRGASSLRSQGSAPAACLKLKGKYLSKRSTGSSTYMQISLYLYTHTKISQVCAYVYKYEYVHAVYAYLHRYLYLTVSPLLSRCKAWGQAQNQSGLVVLIAGVPPWCRPWLLQMVVVMTKWLDQVI